MYQTWGNMMGNTCVVPCETAHRTGKITFSVFGHLMKPNVIKLQPLKEIGFWDMKYQNFHNLVKYIQHLTLSNTMSPDQFKVDSSMTGHFKRVIQFAPVHNYSIWPKLWVDVSSISSWSIYKMLLLLLLLLRSPLVSKFCNSFRLISVADCCTKLQCSCFGIQR